MKIYFLRLVMFCLTMSLVACGNHSDSHYDQEEFQTWECGESLRPTYENKPDVGFWEGSTEDESIIINFEFSYTNEGNLRVSLLDPVEGEGFYDFTISKEDLEDGIFSYTPDKHNDRYLIGFYIEFQIRAENFIEGFLCFPADNGPSDPSYWKAEWTDIEYFPF